MKLEPYSRINQNKRNASVIWSIFIGGLFISALATFYVHQKNINEDRLRFEFEKDTYLRIFINRLESYEGALIQTRAFLLNSPSVNMQQLHQYFKDTQLFERFPGLQGLGYTMLIKPGDIPAHVQGMRKEIPAYKVWPEGERKIYSSIVVLEPPDERNRRAVGYDMFSEPIRRRAMERARDENNVAISDKVVLVQEDRNSNFPGFLMFLPHYREGADLSVLENRRKNIIGFVYAPFRAGELFKAIIPENNFDLGMDVYHGSEINPKNLMFQSHGNAPVQNVIKNAEAVQVNGSDFYFQFYTLPTFNKSASIIKNIAAFIIGMVMTLILIGVYIITRRQMDAMSIMAEEKEKLLEKEKEHVAARDDFLSIASHELKTPLTSLKLQSQVMMRSINRNDPDALSHEKVTALIKQIDNQTSRLTRLVDDMLDISRIRTGRLKMQLEEVNVTEMISDVLERLRPQFTNNGGIPVVKIEEDIIAFWDKFRIEQVLTNLLTNAIRYGNNRPVKIEVCRRNEEVIISVIDQGIGIAPENVDRIFNRFERAGMSASEVSGLGLGLFITHQIVKSHGGTINVESNLGEGSRFHIHLPILSQEQSS